MTLSYFLLSAGIEGVGHCAQLLRNLSKSLSLVNILFFFFLVIFEIDSYYVAQAGIKLNPPTSVFQGLGLQFLPLCPATY